MKKNENFENLVRKMEQLKETEQGKLKGGIAVVNSSNLFTIDGNSNVCDNNGDCSDQDNSGICTNNSSEACDVVIVK